MTQDKNNQSPLKNILLLILAIAGIALSGIKIYKYMNSPKAERTVKVDQTPSQELEKAQRKHLVRSKYVDRVFADEKRRDDRLDKQTIRAINYSGDLSETWPYELTKIKHHNSHSELFLKADVFPTRHYCLKDAIPAEVLEKYKGADRDYLFHFSNPDFPKKTFKHRLVLGENDVLKYDRIEGKEGKRHYIFTNNFASRKSKLSVTVSKVNTESGEKTERKFKIKYDASDKKYKANFGKDSPAITLDSDYLHNGELTSDDKPDALLIRTIYKSLRQLNKVKLKEMLVFTLDDIYLPQLKTRKKDGSLISPEKYKDGFLKYYGTSNEDGIAWASIYGYGFELRYFIDTEKNKVVGMHIVTTEKDSKELELIEVFIN